MTPREHQVIHVRCINDCLYGHDWHLIDETNWHRKMTPDEKTRAIEGDRKREQEYPGMSSMRFSYIVNLGIKRRWYCSRCRTIDTTYEPTEK